MSLSRRRAWFSCTSRPVSCSRRRRWWPGSTTRVVRRSTCPSGSAGVVDQLHLVDVEAQLVEAADPLVDAPLLPRPEHLDGGQLVPQGVVAAAQVLGDRRRVGAGVVVGQGWRRPTSRTAP